MLIGIDASRAVVARRTGTERYALEITRALVEAAPDDRFVLYFNQPPSAGLLPRSARVRWRVIPSPRLWTVGRLSLEMAVRPPDVLFVPAHSLPPVVPRATVATIHDLGYLHFPGEHPAPTRWLRRLANRWSARRATRVVAISGATRDDLVTYDGVRPDRIDVVHHGHAPWFKPVDDAGLIEATKARHGLGAPYFLFIGTLQPRKNLERLLAAFDRVAADRPDLLLALVGAAGWQPERLERALARVQARDRIRLLGYVEDADLPPLLSGSLGLAFPSLYEGFGLPALEAMACATPVLTSNTSSLPEVVGDAALLVDPLDVDAIAEGLRKLAGSSDLRKHLGTLGLARAADFTWQRAAPQTLAVIRSAYAATRK
ncbi:MAG TPA: glycosyltransferase family 1 protein [Chloroflexota bacterium]|nr:glycosyltransferase family 1 protein [Chloroflexota bacterium]